MGLVCVLHHDIVFFFSYEKSFDTFPKSFTDSIANPKTKIMEKKKILGMFFNSQHFEGKKNMLEL
jgi:hypothetical protein